MTPAPDSSCGMERELSANLRRQPGEEEGKLLSGARAAALLQNTPRALDLTLFQAEMALGTSGGEVGQDSPIPNSASQGECWHQRSFCPEPRWPPRGSRQATQWGLNRLHIHLAE